MSLLAAIVDWRVEAPDAAPLGALLSALPSRVPDGRYFVRAPGALLGVGQRIVRTAERNHPPLVRDVRRKVSVVGDLRIDNRDDLRSQLFGRGAASISDIVLLAAGYERWGRGLAERLVGEFAFVIWDWRERRVYAARDPFGVRGLVYQSTPGQLVIATDVAQFLALSETGREPNDQTVVDLLSWSFTHYGPTFFRGLNSVRPGHFLIADEHSLREVAYFRPPETVTRRARTEEYRAEFRELFRQAVADRVDSEYPLVAHLSGGLDSSSIVCMADRIYRDGGSERPSLTAVSAQFPGEPHDETKFVDIVARCVSFPSKRWNGNIPSGWELSRPALGIPGTSVSFNGGSVGDVEIARTEGARVLLVGDGGDYVTGEIGLFNDLVTRGKWLTLLRSIAAARSPMVRQNRFRSAKRAIREEFPPWLIAIWDLKNPVRRGPPAWLNPEMRPLWIEREAPKPIQSGQWPNLLQRGIWGYLTLPAMAWAVDFRANYAAESALETRYPFLDLRLLQFVLSIPVEHRPMSSLPRGFHRQALRGILPDAIAERESKPNFADAVVRWGHASLPALRRVIDGPVWLSERFVVQSGARELLNQLSARSPRSADWIGWRQIRSIVNIEAWYRAILRYPATKESLPMSELRNPSSVDGDDRQVVETPKALPYVAPVLSPVGNVRQLLAAGSTSPPDVPGDPSQGGPG